METASKLISGYQAKELHLVIIWEHALHLAEFILEDLSNRFTILKVSKIFWSRRKFSENLTRFYGQKLPSGSGKERHCGTGPFLLIALLDSQPKYQIRPTSKGLEIVNVNLFDAKTLYRQWTGGGHRIHATNTPQEADHDISLLTGLNYEDFIGKYSTEWDGEIEEIKQDLVGSGGWDNLSQLFYVLNSTCKYVVLRNFDSLPEKMPNKDHPDIDLLVDNILDIRYVTNGTPVFREPYRVLHRVKVGGREILFDFRYAGDNYFDPKWEKDILERRTLSAKGFYTPSMTDHFYSLLYHAIVHKLELSINYQNKLSRLGRQIGLPDIEEILKDPSRRKRLLDMFLYENNYSYVEPNDLSVQFNSDVLKTDVVPIRRLAAKSKSIVDLCDKIIDHYAQDLNDLTKSANRELLAHLEIAYHLSPHRTSVVEALPLKNSESVLLCYFASGPMVRYLARTCSFVRAVELDDETARITLKQNQGLKNVKIDSTSIDQLDDQYDVVLMKLDSSVLITLYDRGWTIEDLIAFSRKLVNENGYLVILCDGKFPLKKLVSSKAEQSESLTKGLKTLLSYSKSELLHLLKTFGFPAVCFVHIYPDSQFPKLFITDDFISRQSRLISHWLASACIETNRTSDSSVPQILRYYEAAMEGLPGYVPNCMMVLASGKPENLPKLTWKIISFGSENRASRFRTCTCVPNQGGPPRIEKKGMSFPGTVFSFNPNMSSKLMEGEILEISLLKSIRDGNRRQFLSVLKDQISFLEDNFLATTSHPESKYSHPARLMLKGTSFDAIPRNLIYSKGRIRSFDLEWAVNTDIPLPLVLYRSILNLQASVSPSQLVQSLRLNHLYPIRSFDDVIWVILGLLGLHSHLSRSMLEDMAEIEGIFQHWVCGTEENKRLEKAGDLIEKLSTDIVTGYTGSCAPKCRVSPDSTVSLVLLKSNKEDYPEDIMGLAASLPPNVSNLVICSSELNVIPKRLPAPPQTTRIHYVHFRHDDSPGAIFNNALLHAEGSFVMFCFSGAVIDKELLDSLLDYIGRDPSIGIICPSTIEALNTDSGYLSGKSFKEAEKIRSCVPLQSWIKSQVKGDDQRPSLCFLVRREVFNLVGGFDTRYMSIGTTLDDFSVRAASVGYKTYLARGIKLHHLPRKYLDFRSGEGLLPNKQDLQSFRHKWKLPPNTPLLTIDSLKCTIRRLEDPTFRFFPPSVQGLDNLSTKENELISLGESYYTRGNYPKAEQSFLKVLSLDPNNTVALNNLFCLYWDIGKKTEAIGYLQRALSLSPSDPDILYNYCQLLLEENKISEAASILRSLKSIIPDDQGLDILLEKVSKLDLEANVVQKENA